MLDWVPSWSTAPKRQHFGTLAVREIMISFELARELKAAGFTQSTSLHAVYALNEHLRIRRQDALQMLYGSKRKAGLALELEEEAVYAPKLSDVVTACKKRYNSPATKPAIGGISAISGRPLVGEGRRRTNRWPVCGFRVDSPCRGHRRGL
jgi:hypothetical protein